MSDPSFFAEPVPLSLDQIAALTGAVLVRGDGNTSVTGVAALDRAGASEFSFVEDKAYWPKLTDCQALAVVCREADVEQVPDRIAVLTAGAPYRVFAAVAGKLFPEAVTLPPMTGTGGVSPLAHVDGSAELEPDVVVEAGAVIGPQVQVGSGTVIGPNAVIAKGCRIGRDCRVGAGAVLQFSLIGDRVILHPGVKLGQDGFGYSMGMKHLKIPQLGRLIIQDDVEIGANTTIDRGSLRDTVVGEGTKIDNLVQIGHNVVIGRHCVIVAEVGISGSAELGDYVVLGGKVAVGEHIKIGTGAQIAGTSAVNDDVPAGERWLGHPAVPFRRWMRERMAVRALANKRGSGTRKEDGKTSGEETAE